MVKHERGLLDTSVVLDFERILIDALPARAAIAAITLAEIAAGPHAARTLDERSGRQTRLQWVESALQTIPFDARAARAYGRIYAAVLADGRKPRGRRAVDLLIAATALARELPLFTRNPDDFASLATLLPIETV